MASLATVAKPIVAVPQTKAFTGLRPMPMHAFSAPTVNQTFAVVRKANTAQRRNASVVQAVSGMEVAQIAGEGGFIGGVAGVMVGITLVGLAIGFIILRVESLVEEGKI